MADDLEKAARETQGTQVDAGTLGRVSGITTSFTSSPGWFGPGKTLAPMAPKDTAGRMWDFPVFYNVNLRPRSYEGVTFDQLRGFADGYDLLRLVIETRKDQIESYSWGIEAIEGKSTSDSAIEATKEFFKYPDQEHPWNTWLRMLLEEMFVIDALCVYPRMNRGGGLYGIELMDGATIKRVLDDHGRTPLPPDPAYQQVLKGLPAVDYTREELIYWMRNPRTSRVYGLSPVEQVIMTVNIALRRQIHQLQFYTEGNIPEAFCGVPDTWGVETLRQFQLWWDTQMEGNTAARRHMKFVPFDASKISYPKQEAMKDQYDEWLARIVCFAFSISPTMLVKETNRATAETVQQQALKEGLVPLLNYLKTFFDFLIQRVYKQPNLEFKWDQKADLDPLTQAQVLEILTRAKLITADEGREELNRLPLTPEQKKELEPPPPPALSVVRPGQPPTKSADLEPQPSTKKENRNE